MSTTNKEVAKGDTPSQVIAVGDTSLLPDDVVAMWKYVGSANVQCHIKGALRALNTLIHLCEKEGAHRQFKHALQSKDANANRVALMLLLAQINKVRDLMDVAEQEHEEFLRVELLAYQNRTKANPQ